MANKVEKLKLLNVKRVQEATNQASTAFWDSIAKSYPELEIKRDQLSKDSWDSSAKRFVVFCLADSLQ
jgi:hypothetical protein